MKEMPDIEHDYDAIVVGSGITGGWAAKELCERGLRTLVLEAGRDIDPQRDYTEHVPPWDMPFRGLGNRRLIEARQKVQRRSVSFDEFSHVFWIDDVDNPYSTADGKPFDWLRARQVGGKSIIWGRQVYRWSDLDFEANARDGIGVDWPIRYSDVAPWYDHVERFIGVSGQSEGLEQLPDSQFLPPMQLNCVEMHLKQAMAQKLGRTLTIGRVAHLTAPLAHSPQRGTCQSRNLCIRGCPLGAYFSSNSSTLPAAEKTGNMTLRPNSIVHEIIYDEANGRATGVRVLDAESNQQLEFHARVIFLCASTFGSTFVLLNSVSNRFPNGFGNDSGELGCNVMDHHLGAGGFAMVDGFEDTYYSGGRPNGFYIPRFANIGKDKRPYLRGFGYQGGAGRQGWTRIMADSTLGAQLKAKAATPGPWAVNMTGFGETLPYHENRVTLDRSRKDRYGLATLAFDVQLRDNESKMRADMAAEAATMLEAAGFKNVRAYDRGFQMGLGIHEMGTARMGRDPKTSVLNEWNQIHACKNVFVTDGSCMTSSACQNPSLTYMALTARAANHAVEELKRKNI